jgi:hypothetical protein
VTARILSPRELNRAVLARQLLLERSRLPLTTAIERVGGLQTQYAPSGYIGLWSRLEDFSRHSLTRALEQRRVVQGWLMRITIHMVSARDFPLLAAGVREARRRQFLRSQRRGLEGVDMETLAQRVRRHLADRPLRFAELRARLEAEGYPRIAALAAGLWVDLVRVPPSGTWERRRADLYALADQWLGPSKATEREGLEHLVRRYLGGFGPASLKDIAGWAGFPVAALQPVIEGLHLRRFNDERGGEVLDLPRAPLPGPETPAPVRFLATWDPMLLANARRTGILPDEYRRLVFNSKTPQSVSTFLVDGMVAGAWRFEADRVRLEPFRPVPRSIRRELDAEAERLAAFHR